MNIADAVVLVISMWGRTESGEWAYIGNQYVNQAPMTLTECSELINPKDWARFEQNPYYKIELACFHAGEPKE